MAHGERSAFKAHRGRDYMGKYHYLWGQDKKSKVISHKLERRFQQRELEKELKQEIV